MFAWNVQVDLLAASRPKDDVQPNICSDVRPAADTHLSTSQRISTYEFLRLIIRFVLAASFPFRFCLQTREAVAGGLQFSRS